QEILHRYVAIDRREAIQPAFDVLIGVVDEVFPVDLAAVDRAKSILYGKPRLSARHAIHLATMAAHDVTRIMTFDSGFDGFPGGERITSSLIAKPAALAPFGTPTEPPALHPPNLPPETGGPYHVRHV